MISYAQNFEDVILWRVFRHIATGHYVDVGAFHPEIDSVTKWFYDQGWSGINIEPVAESFALISESRPRDHNIRAAAGEKAAVCEMAVFPESRGLSSLHHALESPQGNYVLVKVDVLPLQQILEPYSEQPIHFLKIDAEGTEREVLLGMDFCRFRPWVVLVEATKPQTSVVVAEQWREILTGNQYEKVYFDGLNEFFLALEHRELSARFNAPPNVFDDFELAATVRERQWRNEMETVLRSNIAALENERRALLRNVASLRSELTSSHMALEKVRADVAELSQVLKTSRETIETIFRSRSWRWLAPIRKFNFLLRTYRNRIRTRRFFRD